MKNLIFFSALIWFLPSCSSNTNKQYVCPPCEQTCDLEIYRHGGPCPICGMELVEKGTYNQSLSLPQIEQDLDILITTLRQQHPCFYDYQSEDDFNQTLDSIEPAVRAATNVLDEYRIVSRLIALVGDAHTYAMNPYYRNILQEESLFPVIPRIDNNRIAIDGKELQSINGQPAASILKRLQAFTGSDGRTIPYKNAFIEMEFPLKYFTFIDDSPTFTITLEDGKTETWVGKSYFKGGLRPQVPAPSFAIDGDTALLTIPTWEDETASSFNQDLEEMALNTTLGKFIAASLEEAIENQTKHLVVDLTGNKGGKSGPAALLLSYLIADPFHYYREIRIASDSFPTKEYVTNKELVAFYESTDAKNMIQEVNDYYFFKDALLPQISPRANKFLGTVEILVDKYSLSVSTDVVAILKKNRAVKITGSERGGSLAHYCAGDYINLRLPNSGIEVNVPLQRLEY